MNDTNQTPESSLDAQQDASSRLARLGRARVLAAIGGALLAGGAIALAYHHSRPDAPDPGADSPVPVVAVTRVERADLYREVSVPAEFRPYAEVDLHSKVAGYVQQMKVDIGDRVEAGQLLAMLEVPELKDQLDHDLAAEQRADADYRDAHLAYTRLVAVNRQHPNLVAQQDLDTAEAKDATASGALAGAKADVGKDRTLVDYTRISAPFDGVITRRYADPGALIQAGTTSQTQSMPVVRLSDNYRLRLDFPVSVDYVRGIRVGEPLTVRVESLGGKTLTGTIARFTQAVDASTRTMTAEMEVENKDLAIVPGMYATVILRAEHHPNALAIPVEAVPAGSRTAWVVTSANRVEERPISLGMETSTRYEVLSGLREGERVMIGNPAQLRTGERVVARLDAASSGASPGSERTAMHPSDPSRPANQAEQSRP
jgi:RND family efflux transporter MFP subunit